MIFYRYEHSTSGGYGRDMDGEIIPNIYPLTIHLELRKFFLIKETTKGYWIGYNRLQKYKWISKTSKKRFAYPTIEEAKINFIKRKESQIKILTSQLKVAKTLYKMIKDAGKTTN
jgi:hypothetical protein